jgi:hypothetical protein
MVLTSLRDSDLQVIIGKLSFCIIEMQHLGYFLTCNGIKPQQKKVQAVVTITLSTQVKDLCSFVGMVQYYQDLWVVFSKQFAPLTILVGEYSHTKVTKSKKAKKHPWLWDEVHQKGFNVVKATIAKDVVLAYHNYLKDTEICTNASSKQVGSGVTKGDWPLEFSAAHCLQCNRNTA